MFNGFISFIKELVIPEIKANKIVFISIALFLTGFFLIVCLSQYTILKKMTITRVVAFFSVIGLLIPKKFIRYRKTMGLTEYFLLNFFGFGPFITGCLLLLNFLITFNPIVTTHQIVHYELKNTFSINSPNYLIELDDNFLADHEAFRVVSVHEMPSSPKKATYCIAKGLFGVKILKWQDFE